MPPKTSKKQNRTRKLVSQVKNAVVPEVKKATKQALTSIGAGVGARLASGIHPSLGPLGARAGSNLAERISKIIGSGDYTVQASVATNSLIKGKSDFPVSFGDGGLRFKYREFVMDITAPGSMTFATTKIPINPGLETSFPYLSQMAANFEEYKIHGLVYEFKSTTSPYNSNSAMGSVVLSAEFNPDNPDYKSKPQMEASENSISVRPDQDCMYGVECEKSRFSSFLITAQTPSTNLPSYIFANMYVGVVTPINNSGGSVPLGELYVTYDIELLKPRLSRWIMSSMIATVGGSSATNPLGTTVTYSQRTIKLAAATISGNQVILTGLDPGDVFKVDVVWTATTAGTFTAPTITPTYCTSINYWAGNTLSSLLIPSETSTSTKTATFTCFYTVSPTSTVVNPATISFSSTTIPLPGAGVNVTVTHIGSGSSL